MNNTNTNKTEETMTTEKINAQELNLEQLDMVSGGGFVHGLIKFITHATSISN